MKRNDPVKEYFAGEVERMNTPSLPEKYRERKNGRRWKDDLGTLAAVAAVFVLILIPGNYETPIRKAHMSRECYEELQNAIPEIVYNAALYLQTQAKNNEKEIL